MALDIPRNDFGFRLCVHWRCTWQQMPEFACSMGGSARGNEFLNTWKKARFASPAPRSQSLAMFCERKRPRRKGVGVRRERGANKSSQVFGAFPHCCCWTSSNSFNSDSGRELTKKIRPLPSFISAPCAFGIYRQ